MKKNRPGVLLSVLCGGELTPKMEKILFRETGTLGIRRWQACRHKLERRPGAENRRDDRQELSHR